MMNAKRMYYAKWKSDMTAQGDKGRRQLACTSSWLELYRVIVMKENKSSNICMTQGKWAWESSPPHVVGVSLDANP